MKSAEQWIQELDLQPHPEGGYFKEVYRAALSIEPDGFAGPRNAGTHIYYLLEGGDISRFHRIASDELWHFYAGTALTVHRIDGAGDSSTLVLDAAHPFGWVPAGQWFGASLPDGGYALVGCSVAPGFDFSDFEMAERSKMLEHFPQHQDIIHQLLP